MKVIRLNRHKQILTPWLSLDEAAAYCGVSRETFRRYNQILPCPGTGGKRPRYYAPVLSQWMEKIATTKQQQKQEVSCRQEEPVK